HGLEFLDPRHLAPTVDAVVLAGGSAYGLEAIWGVMQWLEERGRGFPVSRTVVPHVAGAIIFDLSVGDHRARPDRAMGHAAAAAAAAAGAGPVAEGSVGAGTGATVGKLYGIERAMRAGALSPAPRHGRRLSLLPLHRGGAGRRGRRGRRRGRGGGHGHRAGRSERHAPARAAHRAGSLPLEFSPGAGRPRCNISA